MDQPSSRDVTQLLLDWCNGDRVALDQLIPLVYEELHHQARRAMRRERADHTLQPTELVHEVFLRLVDQNRIEWQNRAQFFGIAAQLMRRIVLKHARRRRAAKRGGGLLKVAFDGGAFDDGSHAVEHRAEEMLALDQALGRLAELDPRQGKILELRYFGGLTVEEVAACLELSTATVKRETRIANAWLGRELSRAAAGGAPS